MIFSFNYMCLLLVARAGSVPEGEGWVEFMQNQNSLFCLVLLVSLPFSWRFLCPSAQKPHLCSNLQQSGRNDCRWAPQVVEREHTACSACCPATSCLPLSRPCLVLFFPSLLLLYLQRLYLNLCRQNLLLCAWFWSCCPAEGSGNAERHNCKWMVGTR